MHTLGLSAFSKKQGACLRLSVIKYAAMLHGRNGDVADRTVNHLLQHWKSAFIEANISEPEESIEHLMSASLLCSKGDLQRLGRTELTKDQVRDLDRRCRCRLQRMPVQYIVGDWEFCDVTVAVRPPVLIPRPETERLAILAADRIRGLTAAAAGRPRLLEVGCGSGAVTIAVLHWLKQVSAVAVDQSEAACRLTEENAARAGVSDRLQVRHSALTADHGLPGVDGEQFDVVVSNPPYVPSADLRRLQPEILLYEDRAALDGGRDGLQLTRQLLQRAAGWLRPGGRLLLELGLGQPETVLKLLADSDCGLSRPEVHQDFSGRGRFVEARRPEGEEGDSSR